MQLDRNIRRKWTWMGNLSTAILTRSARQWHDETAISGKLNKALETYHLRNEELGPGSGFCAATFVLRPCRLSIVLTGNLGLRV